MFKTFGFAWQALRLWNLRQMRAALLAAVFIGVLIGIVTVLIPNPIFARDIPPVWWNYPVWILTSLVSGLLMATYIRPSSVHALPTQDASVKAGGSDAMDPKNRQGKLGMAGAFLSWFAVGCPVCNKLALLAFGYSGAVTYFAPVQPILGLAALLLAGIALVWRLKGQIICPMPTAPNARHPSNDEPEQTRI